MNLGLFLQRLYSRDKKLFCLFVLYATGILYCIINCNTFLFSKRCEEFPFMLYGMYSLPEMSKQTYTSYSLIIDGKEVNYSRLKDSQRELILSSLSHLSFSDSSQVLQYMDWLFRYSVDMRGLESNRMEVYKLTCSYQASNGKPHVLTRELLYKYVLD